MKIRIDSELQGLIPPLTKEEYQQLEKNIIRDGCHDPLVIWDDTIVDGHNRYAICTEYNLPFQTFSINFESKEAAADWIDTNQLGRRNLSPDQMSLLRGRRYNRLKKAAHGRIDRDFSGTQNEVPKTAEKLASQHGVSRATIERDGQFARAVETVKAVDPEIERKIITNEAPPKSVIIEAAKQETPEAIQEVLKKAAHVSYNTGENEWYTPPAFIQAARAVMGTIDLDPASTDRANQTVQASDYFTSEQDGREQFWSGNVWMNPPYAQPLIADFCNILIRRFKSGDVRQACVLVNNATETLWFQSLLSMATAVCFPKGRVRFLDKDGNLGAPLQGQAVVYFGDNVNGFEAEFSQFGAVCRVV